MIKNFLHFDILPLVLSVVLYLLIYLLRLQQGGWDVKFDLFSSQRDSLDKKIAEFLPSPQAELLSGILIGQNKKLPAGFKLSLRDTSTLHIVVASGQNLSMVAGFFLGLSGLIKKKNAVLLGLLAAILYTLLTGLQVPILRAAVMFGLASLAQLFGRDKDSWRILAVTAGAMLLINPNWITEISFQLSFLATFGVVVVAPIFLKWLKVVPIIGQDLAVTLAAQLMVTPVIAQNFHQISLVSLITNTLILWTIPFIMIGGAIMIILGFFWSFLGQLVSLVVIALLSYFIYIVKFFASLPFAWEYIGEKLWIVWVGYYLMVGGVLHFMLSLNNDQGSDIRKSQKSS
ncbi:hypothetical protein A3B45_04620 [Candidatus Daviesbacteria bacterium RIFCSPLOWO2_01_FULL_39_12]|uniref:ComEC/Rec2-related protein domain-containing protein n=1 Tax=Candidatus Daviesbacteria bacterium RIFCSPLOWO2_01_FULL_39_12 TaxID=1797785 RepID=A0A1F5KMZ3_9BACT|nr:MAG: hypothetical protein A3D79_00120 [Candidatus Daviesbacteria bacterium RIFCSPHIGHO2_02_FULL_39_8]OGE42214.1 MAG: hypothetical protein A3B45_04620 [Candidatus Daviesbacteria bacterium RIFCSPLOWO2_01_FULL_39_12]